VNGQRRNAAMRLRSKVKSLIIHWSMILVNDLDSTGNMFTAFLAKGIMLR